MIEVDWDWLPNDVVFEPVHLVDEPRQGLQRVQYGAPYWGFEMSFNKRTEDIRKKAAAMIAGSEGLSVFNVYDPRTPLPASFGEMRDKWGEIESAVVPDISVKSVSRANSAILIQGVAGTLITTGDPMSFTHNGVRHYYCANQDLITTGAEQSLNVYLRPKIDVPVLDTVMNRKMPRQRFVVDMKSIRMLTDINRFTNFKFKGIEFHGAIL